MATTKSVDSGPWWCLCAVGVDYTSKSCGSRDRLQGITCSNSRVTRGEFVLCNWRTSPAVSVKGLYVAKWTCRRLLLRKEVLNSVSTFEETS